MANAPASGPSPVASALVHGLLSFGFFSAVTAIAALAIHVTGDPAEAGPQRVVALFSPTGEARTTLKDRFEVPSLGAARLALAGSEAQEPSLGVPDPEAASGARAAGPAASRAEAGAGVRINGRTVLPGQSYLAVEQGSAAPGALPAGPPAGTAPEPVQPAALSEAFSDNARAFSNPDNRPVIALVIGGLGTSARQSITAIDDLPSGITLAFVPDASPTLLRRARDTGHETLMELPMEADMIGRARPHAHTLLAGVPAETNAARLASLLQRKPGLYGVISSDGTKFAADRAAGSALIDELFARGLAFVQHPALGEAPFEAEADRAGLPFAAATVNIDDRADAETIEAELFRLETLALEEGYAFGTGFAYPLTVDMVAAWAERLDAKGIRLAPASAIAARRVPPVRTSSLPVAAERPDRTP